MLYLLLFGVAAFCCFPIASAALVPVALINAGATTSYVDTTGNVWAADTNTDGRPQDDHPGAEIADTEDDQLYRSFRDARGGTDGSLFYHITVPNGVYTVELHFADLVRTKQGQRVFDVFFEGFLVLEQYDPIGSAGFPFDADIQTIENVDITDEELTIEFSTVEHAAMISAIGVYKSGASTSSAIPSSEPSTVPSSSPSVASSTTPSNAPSSVASSVPSGGPSGTPSGVPSGSPSEAPTLAPSGTPSGIPSEAPSLAPSSAPSGLPSGVPSVTPSGVPSETPSEFPSGAPTSSPSRSPSSAPSGSPTSAPTSSPSEAPSETPSEGPSTVASRAPSEAPSTTTSVGPSLSGAPTPTIPYPTILPSSLPTSAPSRATSGQPSKEPSATPSIASSAVPSVEPSLHPSKPPSSVPSTEPTAPPSEIPSGEPSLEPTGLPSVSPTDFPSSVPTSIPSTNPTLAPSTAPSGAPSPSPSWISQGPSLSPSNVPSASPTIFEETSPPIDSTAYQPRVINVEANPPHRAQGFIGWPGGTIWCQGRATFWWSGHDNMPEEPFCEEADGTWTKSSTAVLNRQDELNIIDGPQYIDRHDCVAFDANADGIEDIICVVGANVGTGNGWTEVYYTQSNGTIVRELNDVGLYKYPTMRTRFVRNLTAFDGGNMIVIATTGGRRDDGASNAHRMFRLNSTNGFDEVEGPFNDDFWALCLEVVDINNDGVDDLIVCDQILKSHAYLQDPDDGTWTELDWSSFADDLVEGWNGARVGDVTGDGVADLIVAGPWHGYLERNPDPYVRVYPGNASLPWVFDFDNPTLDDTLPFESMDVELIDLNDDGLLDIYVVEWNLTEGRGDYCQLQHDWREWWEGGHDFPPADFVPPPDSAPDYLYLSVDGSSWDQVVMEHAVPGCGFRVQKWTEKALALAHGHLTRPGFNVLLDWSGATPAPVTESPTPAPFVVPVTSTPTSAPSVPPVTTAPTSAPVTTAPTSAPAPVTPTPTLAPSPTFPGNLRPVLLMNAGYRPIDGTYEDTLGRIWSPDVIVPAGDPRNDGLIYNNAPDTDINGTEDDELYRYNRYKLEADGSLIYNITVPNDSYTIQLHFAEMRRDGAGQRLFNILIEGNLVEAEYDCFEEAGGAATAHVLEFASMEVTDGILNIEFQPIKRNVMISAIGVFIDTSTKAPTSSPQPTPGPTGAPTAVPSDSPPTSAPTKAPSPTLFPTVNPTIDAASYQPRVVYVEGSPGVYGPYRANGFIGLPNGSIWCQGRPTYWWSGHDNRPEQPFCEEEDGTWTQSSTALLDLQDELNVIDGPERIDRHSCKDFDVNRDGVEDIICVVGANRGTGNGFTEVYITNPVNGSIEKQIEDIGLHKYPTMRTRFFEKLTAYDGGKMLAISNQGSSRNDTLSNAPRMFKHNATNGFDEVTGPFNDEFHSACLEVGDMNNDGVDDFLICGERGFSRGYIQDSNDGTWTELDWSGLDPDYLEMWNGARIADVTGDGLADLLVAGPWHSYLASNIDPYFRVYAGVEGLDSLFDFANPVIDHPMPHETMDVEVFDVNGDGLLDMYVVQWDLPQGDMNYCDLSFSYTDWWIEGGHDDPPADFVPPGDTAPDFLYVSIDGARWDVVEMDHAIPGCGHKARKWSDKKLALAHGALSRPGYNVLLDWS